MKRGENLAAVRPRGRKLGCRNKLTMEAKQMLELAAQGAGGLPALTRFATERPDIFWPMWSKLLPKNVEVTGHNGKDIVVRFVHEGR